MNWNTLLWIGLALWAFIIFVSAIVPRFFPAIQCKIYDLVSKIKEKK